MKIIVYCFAALFASVVVAHSQTPNLLFYDDFSETSERDAGQWEGIIQIPSEEIWGEGSFENRGDYTNQWIKVTDNDAETYFGEAGQNYMEIWSDGWDSESMWLVANDRFSEPSEVITMSFVLHQPGGTSEDGPRIRSGVGNAVFNANRSPQDAEFQNGDFSGVPDVYSLDETHHVEIVYNNSTETVSYLDGQVDLISNAYDVWVDGEAKLRNHRFNSATDTAAAVGTGLQSLAFVVFGSDINHLLVDEVAVYDAAYVADPVSIPEPIEPGLLFADDFSEPEADGSPNAEIWGADAIDNRGSDANQWIQVSNEDSDLYFGEAGNNYLHLYSDGEDSGSVWISAVNQFAYPAAVVTVNLDFYNSFSDDNGPTMRVGVGDPISSNNNRTHYQFRFENDAISEGNEVIQNDRTQNLQMVYNNTENPVTYLDGQETVAADSYDVWIDGVLVLEDVQYAFYESANAPLGTELTSWGLGIFGDAQNELRIDNLSIHEGAEVTPADGGGMTFADWAANEGIPDEQNGPLDNPAGDGVANVVKFALGIPAMTPARDRLPQIERVSENDSEFLSLQFSRPLDRAGIELALEASNDLITWNEVNADIEVLSDEGDGLQTVRISDTQALTGHDRRFVRLVVHHEPSQ